MEIVISLMLYLGNPPELKEHLLMPDFKTCLAKKKICNEKFKCRLQMQQS